jgi:hypothetical protein
VPIDIYLVGAADRHDYVGVLSDALLEWFERTRSRLRVASPFSRFDRYGTVTLSSSTGDVAAFASAVDRLIAALGAASWSELPPLPANDNEDYEEVTDFDAGNLFELLTAISAAAHEADASGGSIVAGGD